jgi:hypothetical protein
MAAPADDEQALSALAELFGSRARGDAGPGSDWDFAYLADEEFDAPALLGELVARTGSDRVDLVDLDRAGALLRFQAARDGRALFESEAGVFTGFRIAAVGFWCDAGPVLRRAYEERLEALARIRD